jgi:hypothetical protein
MGFSNKTMRAPRWNKPHIQLIDGYYRISACPNVLGAGYLWTAAHAFILARNEAREFGMEAPEKK